MNATTEADAAVLERARDHLFSMGMADAAADLCAANLAYGLAKIHLAQEHCGYPPDATFIGTPDMTITRNSGRWRAGIGYGGRLSWGDGDRDMMVLDVKPNTCGMLVGGLRELPDVAALTRRLHALRHEPMELDGVSIEWDFGTGNHFIDVFEVSDDSPDRSVPPYVFVVHASGAELRGASESGPGLYWDEGSGWETRWELFETPWGPLHLLRGEAARDYVNLYWRTDDFAMRRRYMAASALFGQFEVISNTNHQGLLNDNEVLLGCQSTDVPPTRLLPIMVRADRPAFLLHGLPNLTDSQIDALGFRERAEAIGRLARLKSANILPHGAGYALPHMSRVRRVIEIGDTRYFELERPDQRDTQIIAEPRDLAIGYRDESVVTRTVEIGLGSIAARLQPLFVLKA
jgi:hypothetical protein